MPGEAARGVQGTEQVHSVPLWQEEVGVGGTKPIGNGTGFARVRWEGVFKSKGLEQEAQDSGTVHGRCDQDGRRTGAFPLRRGQHWEQDRDVIKK